jgi:hypothetical protein
MRLKRNIKAIKIANVEVSIKSSAKTVLSFEFFPKMCSSSHLLMKGSSEILKLETF